MQLSSISYSTPTPIRATAGSSAPVAPEAPLETFTCSPGDPLFTCSRQNIIPADLSILGLQIRFPNETGTFNAYFDPDAEQIVIPHQPAVTTTVTPNEEHQGYLIAR